MLVSLSPNGRATTEADEPATTLLVGTIRGVVRFERSSPDHPWIEMKRSIEDIHVSSVAYEPRTGLILAGAHGQGGLWMSRDDGESWHEAMNGIEERHVFHVSVQDRGDDVVLFAGVEPPALYRSDDLGETWQRLPALTDVPGTEKWTFPPPPHLPHAKNTTWHPSNPDLIYVCVEQGALLKTEDGGRSFNEIATYESSDDLWYHDVHRLVICRRDPNEMYLSGGEGVYRTEDGGATWAHVQTRDDRIGYPDALVVDPHNEDRVFVAGAGDPPRTWAELQLGTANAGVIRSEDAGRTWHEVVDGLPAPVTGNIEAMSMHSHPDGIELFLGTATGEVYTSTDRGETWHELASGLPPVSKVHHYRWFLSAEERQRIEELAAAGN